MELALVAYFISILPAAKDLVSFAAYASATFLFAGIIYLIMDEQWSTKFVAWVGSVCVVFTIMNVAIPTQKDAYMIFGAYMTQEIATSPHTIEVAGKVLELINLRIDDSINELKVKK